MRSGRSGRRVGFSFGSFVFLVAAAAHGAPPSPPPAIAFDGTALVVSGLAPGGQAVVFGEAREIADYAATLVRRDEIVTAGADGTARYDLGRAVPQQSMWVVVDLATGGVATAAPEGFRVAASDFHGRGLLRGLLAEADGLEDSRPFLELLVVRPGLGAWGATVGDGGLGDEDGRTDGKLRASLGRMRAVRASGAPPDRFAAGDVVAVVDPTAMELTLVTLPGGQP